MLGVTFFFPERRTKKKKKSKYGASICFSLNDKSNKGENEFECSLAVYCSRATLFVFLPQTRREFQLLNSLLVVDSAVCTPQDFLVFRSRSLCKRSRVVSSKKSVRHTRSCQKRWSWNTIAADVVIIVVSPSRPPGDVQQHHRVCWRFVGNDRSVRIMIRMPRCSAVECCWRFPTSPCRRSRPCANACTGGGSDSAVAAGMTAAFHRFCGHR